MLELWNNLLTSEPFIPHGHCYLWQPALVWLHIISDSLTALAYYSIPITLVYFVRKRQDLPFNWMFLLFGTFIVACGTTHLMEVWTLWHPTYWLSGFLKAMTASASVYTALALVKLVPQALALPSPAQLEAANRELRRAIAERQQVEKERDNFFKLSPDLLCVTRFDGYFKLINPAWAKVTGFTKEELLAKPYIEVIHPEDRKALTADAQKVASGIDTNSFESRVLCKDGSYRWFAWSATAHVEEKFIYVNGRDITERKQVEEALRISQARFAGILDIADDAIISVNESQCIILFNKGAEKIFGYTAGEILGQPLELLLPSRLAAIHHQHVVEFTNASDTARRMGERREIFARRKDGTEFPAEASISQLELGEEKVFTVILRDITSRKQAEEALRESEERFRRLCAASPIGIFQTDERGKCVYGNSRWQEISGLTLEESLGDRWRVVIHPEDREAVVAELDNCLTEFRGLSYEFRCLTPQGNLRWIHVRSSPMFSNTGKKLGYVGTVEDITQSKQAQEKLKQQKELLQTIFDHIPVMVVVLDATSRIEMVNREFERILGWSVEEMQTCDVMAEFYPDPEYRQTVLDFMLRADGKWGDFKTRVRDGRILDTSWANVRLSDGTSIGIGQDVTERKKAEEALLLTDFSFECCSMAATWIGSDARILRVNEAACQSLGYSREELQSMHVYDNDPDFPVEVWPTHWQALKQQKTMNFVTQNRTKDGRFLPVEVTLHYVEFNGKEYNFAFSRDITERQQAEEALRQSEARFRAAAEGSLDAFFLLQSLRDETGRIVDFTFVALNKRGEEMIAMSKEEVIGKRLCELLPIYSTGGFFEKYVRVVETQEVLEEEFPICTPEIVASWIQHQVVPLAEGIAITSRDISERKQAEAALQQANEQLTRSVRELEERNREITLLSEMSDVLQACLTVEEAYTAIATLVQPLFPDMSGGVFILTNSRNLVEAVATWGTTLSSLTIFTPNECWALRRGRTHFVGDTHCGVLCQHLHPLGNGAWGMGHGAWGQGATGVETRGHGDKGDGRGDKGTRGENFPIFPPPHTPISPSPHTPISPSPCLQSPMPNAPCPIPLEYLCVPMMAQGEALGVLYLSSQAKGRLTQAKQMLAVAVAEHMALALANLKLRQTLHNESIRDPLTGLFNRRYLEESLAREIHRCQRKQQSLGVIMLDVDHFKRFNDTFGHDAGDAVLRELGLFLQRQIRGSDIACRYGGEELTLILPEASLELTFARAEQIREGVKHLNVQHRLQPLGIITLSLGVAVFPEHGLTGEALLQAADAALYRAKAGGRDRVCVWR